jgi:hypothetical protein
VRYVQLTSIKAKPIRNFAPGIGEPNIVVKMRLMKTVVLVATSLVAAAVKSARCNLFFRAGGSDLSYEMREEFGGPAAALTVPVSVSGPGNFRWEGIPEVRDEDRRRGYAH